MTLRFLNMSAVLLLALWLGACGGSGRITSEAPAGAAWPGSRFSPRVEPVRNRFAIAPAPDEIILTGSSAAEVGAFIRDYKARGHGPFTILMPRGPRAAQAAIPLLGEIRRLLHRAGVGPERILIAAHNEEGGADPAIHLEYTAYRLAVTPCGRSFSDYTRMSANERSPNFGCALTNSLARMVADPRDLIQARDTDPADATRRDSVLEAYRKGERTGTTRGRDESGVVTNVIGR